MQTSADTIVHSLAASKQLLLRFVEDLAPPEYLHRPVPAVNCVAWILGHLTLSDRSVMRRILGASDLPPLPDGFEKRFSRDEGCPQADEFGDTTGLAGLFARTRDLLIETVKALPADVLGKPLDKPHPMFKTAGEAANFMGLHSVMHAGQISVIRRSLGRPPII